MVTRFAPSPTGMLHLGHALSAVLAHDLAALEGGRFLLRIEDIDATRARAEHVDAILADLAWLGLAHESPVFQSDRLDLYAAALARLKAASLVYPCFCTRADIAAASASAPHEAEQVYPGDVPGVAGARPEQAALLAAGCWYRRCIHSPPPRRRGPSFGGVGNGDRRSINQRLATGLPPSREW